MISKIVLYDTLLVLGLLAGIMLIAFHWGHA